MSRIYIGSTHPYSENIKDTSNHIYKGGTNDPDAVHAAFQTLGPQYQSPPTSAPSSGPPAAPVVNGYQPQQQQQPNVVRHQETFNDGNTTRQVTTETSQEQFGGTTVTKVRRQEVSQSFGAPPPSQQKPSMWTPSSTTSTVRKPMNVRAPPGVSVNQNPGDRSVTLTLGLGDLINKENQAPQAFSRPPGGASEPKKLGSAHMQRIQKVNTARPNAIWTPSHIPDMPDRPDAQRENLMEDMPDFAPEPEPPQMAPEEMPIHPAGDGGRPLLDTSEDEYARMMMAMIMHGPESPNTLYLKKKKVYADSAFYDDPDHKYPTIEEQIKMARKVALSLESPANKKARGHKMFMKRKQKSYRWVAGEHGEPGGFQEVEEVQEEDQPYYRPQPWNVSHTWQPTASKPTPMQSGPAAPPPPAPSLANFNWNKPVYKAPTLPLEGSEREKEEKSKAMSMEEFERMRMFEQKTQHNKVSPAVSFRIAEDLHGLKGKGAKLFAKRKAKSEAWVVEDKFGSGRDSTDSGPSKKIHDPSFVMKLTGGMMPKEDPVSVPSAPAAAPGPAPSSKPRLQEMINPPKAAMSPWDAVANYGDVEKAFGHVDSYMKQKKPGGSFKHQIASNLQQASLTSNKPGVMPEYTRKIQPWDQGSDLSSPSSGAPPRASTPPFSPSSQTHRSSLTTSTTITSSSSSSKLKPWSSTTALNRSPGSSGGFTSNSGSTKSTGFRPVKFKAPGSSSQGNFEPNPTLWQARNPTPAGRSPARSPAPATMMESEDGYCDL